MADPFVAEVRIYPFNFAPTGWAFCNGQLMPISQNTALFSLLGTTYGGDGKTNFALPNLQGSVAMQPGQGQGLSLRNLGETGGAETVTLIQSDIPFHTHALNAVDDSGISGSPENSLPARANIYGTANNQKTMATPALSLSGGSLPHNNMMPSLTLNFCIALQGVFPQRP